MEQRILKIFIADHDICHSDLVKTNLIKKGYSNEVDFFSTEKAIKEKIFSLGSNQRILILNTEMEGVNYEQIINDLKSHFQTAQMPVIKLINPTNRDTYLKQDSQDDLCLIKPICYDKLIEKFTQLGIDTIISEKTRQKFFITK